MADKEDYMKQKIIEMLLTLAMVFSIAATALAEEEGAASSAVSDAAEAGNIS